MIICPICHRFVELIWRVQNVHGKTFEGRYCIKCGLYFKYPVRKISLWKKLKLAYGILTHDV